VIASNAKLTELDLSDNAFGPNGIKGAVNLLSSPACFSLKILTLNNVGLGIGGAKVRACVRVCVLKSSCLLAFSKVFTQLPSSCCRSW